MSWAKVEPGLKVIFIAFICVAILSLISSFKTTSRLGTISDLWRMPSYELHQNLEDRYSSSLQVKSRKKKYEEDHAGRYKSVTYEDDVETKMRTTTIIEDLTKVPPTKDEEEKRKDKKRQENIPLRTLQHDDGRNAPPWTPAGQVWARSQTMDSPFTGARSSWSAAAGLATTPATATSSNSRATEGTQEDMTVLPPAYNGEGHTWQEYV
jgi:hypothetical protein